MSITQSHNNNQPTTLRALGGAPSHPAPFNESALVVIDAQREYGLDGAVPLPGLEPALDSIAKLERAARARHVPVIHVAHVGASGGLFDPDQGGRFLDLTGPEANEQIVQKSLPNSFAGTDLGEVLADLGITNLVLVGFMTHMCVSSTARAALDLGFSTSVIADATATRDLPGADGGDVVPATSLHAAALAALADRFSIVTSSTALLQQG